MNKIDLYHQLPYPLRGLAASLWGHYLRWWRYSPETEKLIEEAAERESWTRERWRAWQEERLAGLLRLSAAHVPYYRDLWDKKRRKGDRASFELLSNWPVLEKKEVRENPRRFISNLSKKKWLYTDHTGGTTGKPTLIYESRETIIRWYALNEARIRKWYNVSRKEPWGILGGQRVVPLNQPKPPYWVWSGGLNQLYLSIFHINKDTAKEYVKALWRYSPTHLFVYPSSLSVLAHHMLEQNLEPPRIKVIISNSEKVLSHQKEMIEKAFGCRLIDTYGMAEISAAASECPQGSLHFWPESGIIETLENVKSASTEKATGQFVITGLFNNDMPLIRYINGDTGKLPDWEGQCACGRSLPLFECIQGRENDLLMTPDGRKLYLLDSLFNGFPIIEAQLVQEKIDAFTVNLVPAGDYQDDTQAEIKERLFQYLGVVKIEFNLMASIPRNENGKFRPFISRVERNQSQ